MRTESEREVVRELFADLVRAGRLAEAEVNAALEQAAGVSLGQCDVLVALSAAPEGRLRMTDISCRLVVTRTAVTRLVDQLERAGHVERAPCAEDRRVIWAGITASGRQALAQATPLFDVELQRLLGSQLREGDAERLGTLLRAVVDAGAAADERSAPTARRDA